MNIFGIYLAFATMTAWALQLVLTRYAAINLNANSVSFVCVSMLIASCTLFVISGNSKYIIKSLKNLYSWAYAITHILLNIAVMIALFYISSAETMALQKFNILTGLIFGYFMFDKRSISKHDIIGSFIVFIGVLITLLSVSYNIVFTVIFIIFSMSILSTLRTNIVERNSLMKQAKTFKQQAQILSMVLFITSFLLIITNIILSKFNLISHIDINITKDQLLIAFINGLFFIPLGMYGFFKTVRAINSENFSVLTAFLPVITLIIEQAASYFNLINKTNLSASNILSLLFIIIGALYITYKRKNSKI